MDVSDWVLVGSVIVALVIGILSLRQTRGLQQKQFRHAVESRQEELRLKLFDEIIEWATEVTKYSINPDIELFINLRNAGGDTETQQSAENEHREQLLSLLLHISKRGDYIRSIPSEKISIELFKAIEEIISELKEQIKLLREALTNQKPITTTDIGLQTDRLGKCAHKVIEETAKLKTAIL